MQRRIIDFTNNYINDLNILVYDYNNVEEANLNLNKNFNNFSTPNFNYNNYNNSYSYFNISSSANTSFNANYNNQNEIKNNTSENDYNSFLNYIDQSSNESFCKRNKKKIIVTTSIIGVAVVLIVFLIVFLKSDSSDFTSLCSGEFEYYKGKCITYAFYASYRATQYYKNIVLFNKNKIDNIYGMKNGKENHKSHFKFYI